MENKLLLKLIISVDRLPFSVRVLLESAVRNCDNFQVKQSDVEKILDWEVNQTLGDGPEVAFKPARVILQVCISIETGYIDSSYFQLIYFKIGFHWSSSCGRFCGDERCR